MKLVKNPTKRKIMQTNCYHYDSCRLPVSICNSECEGKHKREIIDAFEDTTLESLWYLTLECGHKATCKTQNSGKIFCSTCYCRI